MNFHLWVAIKISQAQRFVRYNSIIEANEITHHIHDGLLQEKKKKIKLFIS